MYVINLARQDLKWLQKGLNKKDPRSFTKYILVKDGLAYASNGHVLHAVKLNEDSQEGLYSYDGVKVEDDFIHPLMRQDLITKGYTKTVSLHLNSNNLDILSSDIGIGINRAYFDNATDKATQIKVTCKNDQQSIRIDYLNRFAIIMGVRGQ